MNNFEKCIVKSEANDFLNESREYLLNEIRLVCIHGNIPRTSDAVVVTASKKISQCHLAIELLLNIQMTDGLSDWIYGLAKKTYMSPAELAKFLVKNDIFLSESYHLGVNSPEFKDRMEEAFAEKISNLNKVSFL